MLQNRKMYFLGLVLLSDSSQAMTCYTAISRLKGVVVAMLERGMVAMSRDKKMAKTQISFEGYPNFYFEAGEQTLGQGFYGVIYPLHIVGDSVPVHPFDVLQNADGTWREDLVIKYPHKTPVKIIDKTMVQSLKDEVMAETEIVDFCLEHDMRVHPAIRKYTLAASLDSDPPFLIKAKAVGTPLVQMGGTKNLSDLQKQKLKKLFDDVVEIAKESNILRRGNRISIDIKPNNLYWNGNDWSLYELTRTPKDNLYFLQGGFDAYLNLVDGFVSGLN